MSAPRPQALSEGSGGSGSFHLPHQALKVAIPRGVVMQSAPLALSSELPAEGHRLAPHLPVYNHSCVCLHSFTQNASERQDSTAGAN